MVLMLFMLLNFPESFGMDVCEPKIGHCHYYSCVSRQLGCSKDDYFLAFGEKNCRRFYSLEPYLTDKGIEFTRRSRICLEKKIDEERRAVTCQRSSSLAKGHHISCYVSEGYCDLPMRDRVVIVGSVVPDLVREKNLREAGLEVVDKCRDLKKLQVAH